MTKTEMLDKIAALETKIANLRAALEEPDTPGPWVPEFGGTYFRMDSIGNIYPQKWTNHQIDAARFSIGNVFRTQKDAEFMVERLKVLAELRRLAKGFVPDWGDANQQKWGMNYNTGTGEIEVGFSRYMVIDCANIYFHTGHDVKAAIEAVGAERLKRYYFMVEENV